MRALKLNRFKGLQMGINENFRTRLITKTDMKAVQNVGFEAGFPISRIFNRLVTTNIHRIMLHVIDNMSSFGYFRRGNTDTYESLLKNFKSGYHSANNI